MIATDEMFLPKLGVEKRAIFCVIPDNDDTFNFMVRFCTPNCLTSCFALRIPRRNFTAHCRFMYA